jgi:S1-C subfamily serine protease
MRSGSPAWERGLRTGQVITRVNGERVKGVYALLDALAEAHVQSPNQPTTLTVWDDANQETVVTLDFERWPAEREESRP